MLHIQQNEIGQTRLVRQVTRVRFVYYTSVAPRPAFCIHCPRNLSQCMTLKLELLKSLTTWICLLVFALAVDERQRQGHSPKNTSLSEEVTAQGTPRCNPINLPVRAVSHDKLYTNVRRCPGNIMLGKTLVFNISPLLYVRGSTTLMTDVFYGVFIGWRPTKELLKKYWAFKGCCHSRYLLVKENGWNARYLLMEQCLKCQVFIGETYIWNARYLLARQTFEMSGIYWRDKHLKCQVFIGETNIWNVRYLLMEECIMPCIIYWQENN